MQTGKVAWRGDARMIAFAVPGGAVPSPRPVPTGSMTPAGAPTAYELAGLFVFDRAEMLLTRVPGTERIQRLAFPEFVGDSAVIFLINKEVRGDSTVFRLVCCG